MTTADILAERRAEFDQHVWDHTRDPFQIEFDTRRPLFPTEAEVIRKAVEAIGAGATDDELSDQLRRQLKPEPKLIYPLLQVAGLTRNKILTDLRAAGAGSAVKVPSKAETLPSRAAAWRIAGPYLAARLRQVLEHLVQVPTGDIVTAIEALNQATWPGWIRQERAKRQGHEAELRLATLLVALGLPFEPLEKAENPLCRDAQIHGVSFDLVVPTEAEPVLALKSTVQTSNIGQFGESKGALEITEALQMIHDHFDTDGPTLVAMVDGVGFHSNRAGLDGILENADEFCQFASLWKAAVVAAAKVMTPVEVALPADDVDGHSKFLDRFSEFASVVDLTDDYRAEYAGIAVDAGEALIRSPE